MKNVSPHTINYIKFLKATELFRQSITFTSIDFIEEKLLLCKPITKSDEMIKSLMVDNLTLIELLTGLSEEAEAQKQYATANIAQDSMESHGKFVWQLRAFIEKTAKLSIEDSEQTPIEVPQEQSVDSQVPAQ